MLEWLIGAALVGLAAKSAKDDPEKFSQNVKRLKETAEEQAWKKEMKKLEYEHKRDLDRLDRMFDSFDDD